MFAHFAARDHSMTHIVCLLSLIKKMARVQNWVVALSNHSIARPLQQRARLNQTFMTTRIPFSARMRGANSEPLYASRLYLQRVFGGQFFDGEKVPSLPCVRREHGDGRSLA